MCCNSWGRKELVTIEQLNWTEVLLLWKLSHSVMSNSLHPLDCSPPGSSIRGIFQARVLEWVAISFSRGSSWPRDWTQVSHTAGRHFTIWATREVYFIYSRVYMLISNSWFIPASLGPFGKNVLLFYACDSISVLWMFIFIFLKIPYINNIIYQYLFCLAYFT